MDTAYRFAAESSAARLKVGAIVVKDERIISIGYNGTPSGWDNECETKDYMSPDAGGWLDTEDILAQWPYEETIEVDEYAFTKLAKNGFGDPDSYKPTGHKIKQTRRYALKTKPEVLHAERNAIDKLARGIESSQGATMFITHSPCLECAKSIYGAGIVRVCYAENYRDTTGIEFLEKAGVEVTYATS